MMVNTYVLVGIAIIILFLGYMLYAKSKAFNKLHSKTLDILKNDYEMRQTLAMGLYLRFNRGESGDEDTCSASFLKGDPYEFESFIAEWMQDYYGGEILVTPSSGDFGVDIEHIRSDGLYLGQVKCCKDDLGYEPIAIIHSQMTKQNARGGFVVTTSTFTESAKLYALNLGIELVDGTLLSSYWSQSISNKLNSIKQSQEG